MPPPSALGRCAVSVTHVTEWGLADCAGRLRPIGRSLTRAAMMARMKRLGLRRDTVACDGTAVAGRFRAKAGEWVGGDVILSANTTSTIPTCPRCAVLRDEALEGRLPKR